MNKVGFALLLCLLSGCSGHVNPGTAINKSNADDKIKAAAAEAAAAEAKGDKWQRRALKIGDGDFVRFVLRAANQDLTESPPRIILGCGDLPSLGIQVPSARDGTVRLAFDQDTLGREKWLWFPKDHYLGPPTGHPGEKKFLAQMMNSKTLRFEFAAQNGRPQLAVFNMLDIKDLVNQEPVCDFWLPLPR